MEQVKIINNVSERVVEDLHQRLARGWRVEIAASFSLYIHENICATWQPTRQRPHD